MDSTDFIMKLLYTFSAFWIQCNLRLFDIWSLCVWDSSEVPHLKTSLFCLFLCFFFSFYHSLSLSVCSSRVGVSWRWCCRTLWLAVCLSSVCRRARPWSCWRDLASDQAGVWCAPRIRARLRRVWCPAPHSVSPIPAAVSRWTASSLQAKVWTDINAAAFLCFFLSVPDCQMCSWFLSLFAQTEKEFKFNLNANSSGTYHINSI